MNPYQVHCPSCQTSYEVSDEHAGAQTQCQNCQSYFTVPSRAQAESAGILPASSQVAPQAPTVPKWYKTLTIMGPLCALLLVVGGGAIYWIINNRTETTETNEHQVEVIKQQEGSDQGETKKAVIENSIVNKLEVKWQIQPVYDSLLPFTKDGMAAVQKDGKWGFVNLEGKLVIPCSYEIVKSFSGGRAAFYENDLWGFIDKTGKRISEPIWEDTGFFSGGLCRVQIGDKWGFINDGGKVISKPQWYLGIQAKRDLRKDFGENENIVAVYKNRKWGALKKDGTLLAELEWDDVHAVGEDYVALSKFKRLHSGYSYYNQLVFIDKNEKILFDTEKSNFNGTNYSTSGFSEGLADISLMTRGGARTGYINRSGKVVMYGKRNVERRYNKIFSDGIAARSGGRYGMQLQVFDETGEILFERQNWRLQTSFKNGVAIVSEEQGPMQRGRGTLQLIDKTGSVICQYPGRFPAMVGAEDRWCSRLIAYQDTKTGKIGYLDLKGNKILEARFDWIEPFMAKYTALTSQNGIEIYNNQGLRLCAPLPALPPLIKKNYYARHPYKKNINYFNDAILSNLPIPAINEESKLYGFLSLKEVLQESN